MRVHLPRPTYIPFPVMLALQGLVWATETQLTDVPAVSGFLASIPLPLLWTIVLSFTAGLLLQDLYNPASWLRTWWLQHNQLAEWGQFNSRGYRSGGVGVTLALTALREIDKAGIVVRFVSVQAGDFTLERGKYAIDWKDVRPGEAIHLPVASISSLMPNHGPSRMVWWSTAQDTAWDQGNRDTRNQPLSIVRIEIDILSRFRRQKLALLAACTNYEHAGAAFVFWEGESKRVSSFHV